MAGAFYWYVRRRAQTKRGLSTEDKTRARWLGVAGLEVTSGSAVRKQADLLRIQVHAGRRMFLRFCRFSDWRTAEPAMVCCREERHQAAAGSLPGPSRGENPVIRSTAAVVAVNPSVSQALQCPGRCAGPVTTPPAISGQQSFPESAAGRPAAPAIPSSPAGCRHYVPGRRHSGSAPTQPAAQQTRLS